MPKFKIIPETSEYEKQTKGAIRISYTYLHGKIESDAGYDIFGIKGWGLLDGLNLENNYLGSEYNRKRGTKVDVNLTGVHNCTFNNKPCTFFLWTANHWDSHSGIVRYHGLVVYDDDKEAYEYALNKYIERTEHLKKGGNVGAQNKKFTYTIGGL